MRTVAAVVALVVCVHAGLWMLFQRQQAAASIDAPLASISYSPYARSQHPDYGDRPTPQQIRADLKVLSPYTQAIRTYSSTGGGEPGPAGARGRLGAQAPAGPGRRKERGPHGAETPAPASARPPLQQHQRNR